MDRAGNYYVQNPTKFFGPAKQEGIKKIPPHIFHHMQPTDTHLFNPPKLLSTDKVTASITGNPTTLSSCKHSQ
jgi:hypothetical protein